MWGANHVGIMLILCAGLVMLVIAGVLEYWVPQGGENLQTWGKLNVCELELSIKLVNG